VDRPELQAQTQTQAETAEDETVNTFDDLLAAIGRPPCLPGAACRHRHALFDPPGLNELGENVEQRHRQALSLCRYSCPSLSRCEAWLISLPDKQRPVGVVAGIVTRAD
jgi:hypothetical protein